MQRCDSFRISRLIVPILGIGKPEPHSPDDVGAVSIRILKGIAHDRSVTTEDENGREFFLTAKQPRPQRAFAFFASLRFIFGGDDALDYQERAVRLAIQESMR